LKNLINRYFMSFSASSTARVRTYVEQALGDLRYRQRWLALTAKNPVATRTELSLLDSTCHKWLIKNDADWLEFNRPPSKKVAPTWIDSDDEYLQRIVNAINQIRNTPGRPKQITVFSIGKRAGITKPYTRLTSDKLPKTKAFVAANTETFEQWQERKILWAIQQMRERSEILTVNKVRQAACITYKERKFDNFILEHIKNSE